MKKTGTYDHSTALEPLYLPPYPLPDFPEPLRPADALVSLVGPAVEEALGAAGGPAGNTQERRRLSAVVRAADHRRAAYNISHTDTHTDICICKCQEWISKDADCEMPFCFRREREKKKTCSDDGMGE